MRVGFAFAVSALIVLRVLPTCAEPPISTEPAPVDTWDRSYSTFYDDKDIRITVAPPTSHEKPDLLVLQRPGQEPKTVKLPSQIGEVSAIQRVSSNNFAIFQTSPASYSDVSILDTRDNTFKTDITCYNPSLSPDHRFLAFTKFYPPHGGDDPIATSDFALVYDLSRDNLGNIDPRRPLPDERDTYGTLIFPDSWTLKPNVHTSTTSAYSFPSPYVWNESSRTFIFLSTVTNVDFDYGQLNGNDTPPVESETQDKNALFVLARLLNGRWSTSILTKAVCFQQTCALSLIGAQFLSDSVVVFLTGTGYPTKGTPYILKLPLSGFRPIDQGSK